jgi:hypothetical protein
MLPIDAGSGATVNAANGSPLPPAGGTAMKTNYRVAPGATADVPTSEVTQIASQGFFAVGDGSGPTTARPTTGLRAGHLYIDTTLNVVAAWDGVHWRNPCTGATV